MSDLLRRLPPEALQIIAGVVQYGGAALAVLVFPYVAPIGVAWWRSVIAGLVLVLLRRSWKRHPAVSRWVMLGYGASIGLMNLAFYVAIDLVPLGAVVAIEFIGPTAVAAFGSRTRAAWLAVILAAVGVTVLSGVELEGSTVGVLWALPAGLFWALYIVMGRKVAVAGPSIDGLGIGLLIGALVVAPVSVVPATAAFDQVWLLGAVALIALLSNVVPFTLDQFIFPRVSRERFAILAALLPVTAALVGLVVLAQVPGPAELVGIGLVVAAVMVSGKAEAA